MLTILAGQVYGQYFSAKVIDAETKEPLIGANVELIYSSDSILTITDTEGVFTAPLSNEEVIIYISYLGFERLIIPIIPDPGIDYIFPMFVDESNIAINPIIIANPFVGRNVVFNRKEFQVLPGAYEDPSRLLMKSPGFSTANDQANYILYKGMPSQYITWSINGAPVVNPNHLSNAGSLSDLSSLNAGGVNMISGQVIGKYDFAGAPYSMPVNDVLGGFSNIEFSDYDNTYLNFSLIGLEAGYGLKNDVVPGLQVNYRYSTVGLLSAAGLDFGNERIDYQDLFVKAIVLDNKKQKLETFVTIGNNHNYHTAKADRQSVEIYKDLQDIDFESKLLLSGVRYAHHFKKADLNAVVNYSIKNDKRFAATNVSFASSDELIQELLSTNISLDKKSKNTILSLGVSAKYMDDYRDRTFFGLSQSDFRFQNVNVFPYTQYQYQNDQVYFSGGLGLNYNAITGNTSLDPSLKVNWMMIEDYSLQLSYRKNSQLLSRVNFSYDVAPEEVYGNHLDGTFSIDKKNFDAFFSGFYHHMNNILVEESSNYSQFTGMDNRYLGDYNFSGEGRIWGVSFGGQIRNLLIKNLNASANASYFQSQFLSSSQAWLDNTFGFDQSGNIMLNYTSPLKKDRELVISLSYHNRGPLKEFDIDQMASQFFPWTVFDFNSEPSARLSPYERVDFRIIYNIRKGSHRKQAQSLSLDILNVMNRENDGFFYYDSFQQKVLLQNQLGIIPILAYRIEF